MLYFEIHTRAYGLLTFSSVGPGRYIHARFGNTDSWFQPCEAGRRVGNTLTAPQLAEDVQAAFEARCRGWWRAQLRILRNP